MHHFDQSLSTPYPLLTAMGARTTTLELGTGVIDLRYEQPLAMAEIASAADLITGGRLQLGISRGSPERAVDGQERFGLPLPEGASWSDLARERAAHVRRALRGEPQAHSALAAQQGAGPDLPIEPHSPGLADRLWWGAGNRASGLWAAEHGYRNTVVMVELDMRVVGAADYVIDLGPGAGDNGGTVVASGTPAERKLSTNSRGASTVGTCAADGATTTSVPSRLVIPTCTSNGHAESSAARPTQKGTPIDATSPTRSGAYRPPQRPLSSDSCIGRRAIIGLFAVAV